MKRYNDVAHVETRVEPGGWTVTIYDEDMTTGELYASEPPKHIRRKKSAMLVGRGAAWALGVEHRITDSHGTYTDEGASYGNDPKPPRGSRG